MSESPDPTESRETEMDQSRGRVEEAASRIYSRLWSVLVEWFRVPRDPPSIPATGPGGHDAFKPAVGFLRYLKLWFWIACVAIDLLILTVWIVITVNVWWLGLLLVAPALVIAIAPDIVAFVAVQLRFDTTWYVLTDRSMRIRRGVWIIHETTITFENVQNVKVTQGPVQRYFGIANVTIETAGAGGDHSKKGLGIANRGVIEGIADAHRIRDLILAKMRQSTTTGLGDEEESSVGARSTRPTAGPSRPAWTAEHLALLRDIRDELAASNP